MQAGGLWCEEYPAWFETCKRSRAASNAPRIPGSLCAATHAVAIDAASPIILQGCSLRQYFQKRILVYKGAVAGVWAQECSRCGSDIRSGIVVDRPDTFAVIHAPSPRFQDADLILSSDALPEGAGACAVQPDPAKLRIPLTRLVATLGPNSNSVQALSSLLQAGMQARPAATGTGDAACADRRAGSA